jgi:hypothetical protein
MSHASKPVSSVQGGTLNINGKEYVYCLDQLPIGACAKASVTLYRGVPFEAGFHDYTVAVMDDGHKTCTCEDFTYRRNGAHCKHIQACTDCGLFNESP